MDAPNQWRQLLEAYFATKRIYLTSEEIDDELKTNLQPLNEFKAALDHVMRAKASEDAALAATLASEPLPQDYAETNLDSAIGHMYRAFFDVCDSASISYRERIRQGLKGFSKEAIATALPDYYPTIRPRIEEINLEIASMRTSKGQDPSKRAGDIGHYVEALDELAGYCKKVGAAQVSLIELRREEERARKREKCRSILFQVVVPLLIAALSLVGGFLLGRFL